MFKIIDRVSEKLGNVRVSRKLLMIYFCCVLVPIIVTNLLFAARITDKIKKEQLQQAENSIEIMRRDIKKELENVFFLSTIFYTDRTLYERLEKQYADESEYYEVFSSYLDDYIKRNLPLYKQISRISLYTDNTTILLNGDLLHVSEELPKYQWYGQLHNKDNTNLVFPYYEEGKKYISIIRKLHYFYGNKYKKILKIDLNIDTLTSNLDWGGNQRDVFLIDKRDRIILSSNPAFREDNSFIDFNTVSINPEDSVLIKELSKDGALKGWRIVGVYKAGNMFDALTESIQFVVLTALINLLLASGLILLISKSISKRLRIIADHIKAFRTKNMEPIECKEGLDEIGEVIREFNNMSRKMKEMILNEYESSIEKKNLQIERKQAELNALQSQINPHFLFNTLESIRMRSSIKHEHETANIIKYLSKIFRQMVIWGNDLIHVKDELSLAENYLKIQKYRFGDKIDYEIDVDPEAADRKIPKMTIQPILENACVHGVENATGKGKVVVRVELNGDFLNCTIEDDGKGMDEDRLNFVMKRLQTDNDYMESIGMKNVYNRLKLFYGENFTFQIESKIDKGTRVLIRIPADLDKEKLHSKGE